MYYGKAEVRKRREEFTSELRRVKYQMREWFTYGGTVLLLTVLLMVFFGVAGAVRGMIDSAPEALNGVSLVSKQYDTRLYDTDNKVIEVLAGTAQTEISADVADREIPECVRQAFVASEDKRFYEHLGVDLQGIMYVIFSGIFDGDKNPENVGTITQQLIENLIFTNTEQNSMMDKITRRVQEQYLAVELENHLGKEQILEQYLNTIYFGQNIVGVQMAAQQYFNKNIEEINISEAAALAAIASSPTEYNPYTRQNQSEEKRRSILNAMLEAGSISEDEHEDALGTDVYQSMQTANSISPGGQEELSSYYVDAVLSQVLEDMREQLGYSYTQAYNAIHNDGLKIYTCQDRAVQNICNKVINNDSNYPSNIKSYLSYRLTVEEGGQKKEYTEVDIKNYFYDKEKKEISLFFASTTKANEYIGQFKEAILGKHSQILSESMELVKQPQASFVLLEQSTGNVLAIVGGRGQRSHNRVINRATDFRRQPGEVLNVLSTYLPALDTAGFTLGSVEDDTRYDYPGTDVQVRSSRKYKGLTTLRTAIQESLSVPAVKTLEQVSVQTGCTYLEHLGMSASVGGELMGDSNVVSELQLPLAVGDMTNGVTNLELTAAYGSLANTGVYQTPRFYTKVVDYSGNVLLSHEEESTKVMKSETAWLLTDVLAENMQYGEGREAYITSGNIAQAGKGGTTANRTDFWFVGYSPYYTAGIWCGEDENVSQKSSDYYKTLWRKIMEKVHQQKQLVYGVFEMPDHIIDTAICTKCGKLAVDGLCYEAEGGSTVMKEYFVQGTEPKENCDCHVKFRFCKKSGKLAGEHCPKKEVYEAVLLEKNEEFRTEDTPYVVSGWIGEGEVCKKHN